MNEYTFPMAFRDEMERAGMTQREVARQMGLSSTAVWYWANGRSVPTLENVVRLERILGCKQAALLSPLAYPTALPAVPVSVA